MHGQASTLIRRDQTIPPPEAPITPGNEPNPFEEPAGGMGPHRLWLNMVRERVLVLTMLLLALAAGAASSWLIKPVFSARATIQIDPHPSLIPGSNTVSSEGKRIAGDRLLRDQIDLLANRSTARNVAAKLGLEKDPRFLRDVGLDKAPAGVRRDKAVTALQDSLSISSPGDTGIVALRVDSHDPAAAARTANAFAETFVGDSLKRRLDNYDLTRRILHGQVDISSARLAQAERRLMSSAVASGGLAHLNTAYALAQSDWTRAQDRWEQAIASPPISNDVSIIDRAQMPSRPAYPRPAINMAVALLAGIAFAIGAGVSSGSVDKQAEPGVVARDFDAPLLGVVTLPAGGEDFAFAPLDPLAPASEAHQAIFLALDRGVRTADHKVLLLTSSCANKGRSIIALTLCANFAAAGKKVLAVDADVGRGSLHRMLGLPNGLGLADLLAKGLPGELTKVARYHADRGFSVLTRGQATKNSAGLVAVRRFAELLDEAVNSFDVVILDGPPVLGLADAPRLSGMADATVLVLQADRKAREDAKLALRQLSEAGAGQVGLVISNVEGSALPGAPERAPRPHRAADATEASARAMPLPDLAGKPVQDDALFARWRGARHLSLDAVEAGRH